MKFLAFIIAALLLTPKVFAAEPKHTFNGEKQALLVCKAVVSNDPERLGQMLASYQQQKETLAYYLPKHNQVILKDFVCNDMSLYDFSIKVGANGVNRDIRQTMDGEPRIYIEDVAGHPQRAPEKYYF